MKFELLFIPFLGTGHLRSTVEMAKLLVEREARLSITLIILPGGELNALLALPNDRLRYEVITNEDQPNIDATNPEFYVEYHVPEVRGVVAKLVYDYSTKADLPKVAGVVVDMFCTSMVDVANDFGLPSYLFYTSNAGVLALKFHIQMLYDDNKCDITESDFEESEAVLDVPSLTRPFPVKCLPHAYASKQWLPTFINQARKFKEMKGILVNTVAQLEPYESLKEY